MVFHEIFRKNEGLFILVGLRDISVEGFHFVGRGYYPKHTLSPVSDLALTNKR